MVKTLIYGAVVAFFVIQTANVPPVHLNTLTTTQMAAAH